MPKKFHQTSFHKKFGKILDNLDEWTANPWRKYSFLLIIFFIGFLLGSSLGMINGTLALMDPVGAFVTVILLEFLVRIRRNYRYINDNGLILNVADFLRIGLFYGLCSEGFKLL